MKLLFDHNISPDLILRLHDLFPGSNHVYHLNLHEADDSVLWTFARELSMLRGFPPKLLWLGLGNCRTGDIEILIRSNYQSIVQLIEDEERGILSLFGKSAGPTWRC